ncbi:MAG: class I SAM-dependent methyltransferase [Alphaproteobacteria bacterium]|nr:class I SAM-dependent methyltransferase [Alphaproteobacteria bacterium]
MSNACSDQLHAYSVIWRRKPALRAVYSDFFSRIARMCRPGNSLELGSGVASMKDVVPNLVASDLQACELANVALDAHYLPFQDDSFDNIVMIDVLHHLAFPLRFLSEAQRCLRPQGRLVILEPAMTPFARFVYGLFHAEHFDEKVDLFSGHALSSEKDPYDANMAIPSLLFSSNLRQTLSSYPELKLVRRQWFSFLVYPLTGGFQRWCLMPTFVVPWLLKLEAPFERTLGRYLGLRMFIVLEKAGIGFDHKLVGVP